MFRCSDPSATAIKHIVEKVSEEMEPHQEALDTTIQASIEAPADTKVLVASMDGANVLLREPGVRRGRPSERPRPQEPDEPKNATYKNAMVGAISFYGAVPDDYRGPERLRSLYSARMPEDRAVTFKRDFERHLEILEGHLDPASHQTLLCDGHRVLWNYADHNERFDHYEKLVDFYHRMSTCPKPQRPCLARTAWRGNAGTRSIGPSSWNKTTGCRHVRRSLDYYGRTRGLSHTSRKAVGDGTDFLPTQQAPDVLCLVSPARPPIGSGPVEAACKNIVKTRLCRSGMRWSRQGGQRILNFRCYVKSGLWKEFWEPINDFAAPRKSVRKMESAPQTCHCERSAAIRTGPGLRPRFCHSSLELVSDFDTRISAVAASFLCGFPPQTRIVLPFENPPDVLRAVGRLAHEVPAGIEERLGRLHLGRGLACAAGTRGLA